MTRQEAALLLRGVAAWLDTPKPAPPKQPLCPMCKVAMAWQSTLDSYQCFRCGHKTSERAARFVS